MLVRVLLLLIVVIMVLSVVRRLFSMLQAPRNSMPTTNAGRLVKDPVCGMYIPADTALSAGNEFFCSAECRAKYLKNSR
jgi:YHS domain-containing protein